MACGGSTTERPASASSPSRGKEEYSSKQHGDRDRGCPEATLVEAQYARDDGAIEWPIEHRDVTTIMALLGDLDANVRAIRNLLEEGGGEEEEDPEVDS